MSDIYDIVGMERIVLQQFQNENQVAVIISGSLQKPS